MSKIEQLMDLDNMDHDCMEHYPEAYYEYDEYLDEHNSLSKDYIAELDRWMEDGAV